MLQLMPDRLNQTAILIFTRTPVQEAASKVFDQNTGKHGNQIIAHCLIHETIKTARRTQLPVFIYYDQPNAAETFGEHFAKAFDSVFAKGFSKVIAIGNDCPDLSVDLLLQTSDALCSQKLVLGPATDGGVYLIGIQQQAYQRQAFVELPWETNHLQSGWKQYSATNSEEISWLEFFNDLDHPADFKAFLKHLPSWNLLKKHFLSVLASVRVPLDSIQWNTSSLAVLSIYPLRGPPPY
jgi:glycosyltransferase A (GT-A) superfamily protein (DUF2064 family)